jgi:hypothetical protein
MVGNEDETRNDGKAEEGKYVTSWWSVQGMVYLDMVDVPKWIVVVIAVLNNDMDCSWEPDL